MAFTLAAALAAKPSSPSAARSCPSSRGALVCTMVEEAYCAASLPAWASYGIK